jgi:hypothetical protein
MKRSIAAIGLLLCGAGPPAGQHQHHGPAQEGRFNPFVIADGRGGFYISYVERGKDGSDLFVRRLEEGREAGAPVRVNDRPGDAVVRNENPPKLALGPRGELYVAWANERGRWMGNLRVSRSLDGGKTFAPAIDLNSDADSAPAGHAFQSITVDRAGRILVAWIDQRHQRPGDRGAEIWMATSADGGRTFSRDRRILADVCECCRITIQSGGPDMLALAYRTVPRSGPMHRDIVVASSRDGGESWVPAVVSRDGWEVAGCPVVGPSLTVAESGAITVVWYTGGGEQPGLYYATSGGPGASFASRRRLDPERSSGRHAQSLGLSGGPVLVAWDDAGDPKQLFWGILDPVTGIARRLGSRLALQDPTVAASGRSFVIAAARAEPADVVVVTERITAEPAAAGRK